MTQSHTKAFLAIFLAFFWIIFWTKAIFPTTIWTSIAGYINSYFRPFNGFQKD